MNLYSPAPFLRVAAHLNVRFLDLIYKASWHKSSLAI